MRAFAGPPSGEICKVNDLRTVARRGRAAGNTGMLDEPSNRFGTSGALDTIAPNLPSATVILRSFEFATRVRWLEGGRLITLEADSSPLGLLLWPRRSPQIHMKAKLLWNSWLHVALAAMIAIEAAFLWWCVTYIVPVYQRFRYDGWMDGDDSTRQITSWTHSVLSEITKTRGRRLDFLVAMHRCAWAGALLFLRLRNENKRLIGLSTLATAALGLMMLASALTVATIIPLVVGITTIYSGNPEQIVQQQLRYIDTSVGVLEHAVAKGDWDAMQRPARLAAARRR